MNQFACLRQVVQLIHTEMSLDSEVALTKAFTAMKTSHAFSIQRESEQLNVYHRQSSNPMEMVSEYADSSNTRQIKKNNSDVRMSTISKIRLQT